MLVQFVSAEAGVTGYRVIEELPGISISAEGWLYLSEPLTWSVEDTLSLQVSEHSNTNTQDKNTRGAEDLAEARHSRFKKRSSLSSTVVCKT